MKKYIMCAALLTVMSLPSQAIKIENGTNSPLRVTVRALSDSVDARSAINIPANSEADLNISEEELRIAEQDNGALWVYAYTFPPNRAMVSRCGSLLNRLKVSQINAGIITIIEGDDFCKFKKMK